MKKTEEQLARELDTLLTARLQGRPVENVQEDEDVLEAFNFAAALADLAAATEPDPDFVIGLEAGLVRATSRQNSKTTPERPSFWHTFTTNVKEGFTMKRTAFAFATFVVLLVVGFFAWNTWQGGRAPEPGAPADAVAVVETPTVETTATEEPGEAVVAEPTAAPSDNEVGAEPTPEATTPEAETAEPIAEPGAVPALPLLGAASGVGSGMGGGGGDGATMPIDTPDFYNPWSDTVYTLNGTLPTEPTAAIVYEHPSQGIFTLEDVARYAQLFGVNGPVYVDSYPEPAAGEPDYRPPTIYHIFDGPRELVVADSFVSFFDQEANMAEFVQLPEEQVIAVAEQYLRERGLLDFEYQTRYFYGNTAEFRRVVDGHVVIFPEYQVSVSGDGRVSLVSYNPLSQLVALGNYPLRSAEEAWQMVLENGIDYENVSIMTYPGPDFEMPVEVLPVDIVDSTNYWTRGEFDAVGDTVTLYPYPVVYLPANNDAAPRIIVDRFLLQASDEDLWAIAEYVGKPIRLTGTITSEKSDNPMQYQTLELVEWEPVVDEQALQNQFVPGLAGTIGRNGDQVLFTSEDGSVTYALPGAPADLADGTRVYLYGYRTEETDANGNLIFNWQNMERIVEVSETPTPEMLPADVAPYKVGEVVVDSAELVYVYTPVWDDDGNVQIFLQPAWRFKGATDTKEIAEIYVQAVPEAYVQAAPAQ